ncbi:MAG TPA: SRPBCC family protein [Coriobacteriia bacterium]|jgi:uncharacterized membrane protein
MIRTRNGITIDRPVAEVFDYMAHFENDMEWRNELLEIQRTSEAGEGEGATYRQRVQYEGFEGDALLEVTGFQPNCRIAYREVGDLSAEGEYRFTAGDGHTCVEVTEDIELQGPLAEAAADDGETVRQQGELDLEHLKDILEHRPAWRR